MFFSSFREFALLVSSPQYVDRKFSNTVLDPTTATLLASDMIIFLAHGNPGALPRKLLLRPQGR